MASSANFDPTTVGLPDDFILTDFTRLKGCSCKLPQAKLLSLLDSLESRMTSSGDRSPHTGIADCSVVPLHHCNEEGEPLYLVSTTDFFFPIVEDPYLQGQIGAANVLSDLYSMGITRCDNMLMLLAASTDMDEVERTISTREILRGFADRVRLAETIVTGGQTVLNPWPLIGGVAMSVVTASEMIDETKGNIRPGDVLVLTKPLGSQVAVNLKQWLKRPSPMYIKRIDGNIRVHEINELYDDACRSMRRLNRTAAELMHVHKAHGATDVTGFGILGHARNLGEATVRETTRGVCLLLDTLPIYRTAVKASRLMNDHYHLLEGLSAETSGGLLVALDNEEVAEAYIKDIQLHEPNESAGAWVVGRVIPREEGEEFAKLHSEVQILEI